MDKPYKKKTKPMPGNLIYGVHPVIEALEADRSLDKILISRSGAHARVREIKAAAHEIGIPVQMVPDTTLHRLCPAVNHQGVVAFAAAITYQGLEELLLAVIERGEVPFLVMLDGITDVRNFGAIARTAECMGAHGIIVPSSGAAAANADAVKVSAGALHHIPVCRIPNLIDATLILQAYGVQHTAITEKASETIYDVDCKEPQCLIMGSEERGVSSSLLRRVDQLVKIPMKGQIGSLNVSVAAGIAMAEVVRQRSS